MKASAGSHGKRASARASRRAAREARTIRLMLELYCREQHRREKGLCADCDALWSYARERLDRCPFRADKPTCLNCRVHCFKPDRREQIRLVMRYAGPRMAWRHPVLSLFHFLDGRAARQSGGTP